jgi:NhaA family Na+:H+ antiporter
MLASSSVLTGIGFTMSLFIADLALQGPELAAAKVGVLTASTVCALVGLGLLHQLHRFTKGTER